MSSKVKYNYELFKLFCQVNQLNIVDNLNNSDIGCNTIIEDKCINKNCNNYFTLFLISNAHFITYAVIIRRILIVVI